MQVSFTEKNVLYFEEIIVYFKKNIIFDGTQKKKYYITQKILHF